MKNFFKSKKQKGNPFTDKDKGDENKTMAEEIKEQEIIEEQNDENQTEIKEENNSENNIENNAEPETAESEADKLKKDFENLNNQYLRLAADFENYRKRQAQERAALLQYGA